METTNTAPTVPACPTCSLPLTPPEGAAWLDWIWATSSHYDCEHEQRRREEADHAAQAEAAHRALHQDRLCNDCDYCWPSIVALMGGA